MSYQVHLQKAGSGLIPLLERADGDQLFEQRACPCRRETMWASSSCLTQQTIRCRGTHAEQLLAACLVDVDAQDRPRGDWSAFLDGVGGAATAGVGLSDATVEAYLRDMRQFADLLAVQFSIPTAPDPTKPVRAGGTMIPVLDKTGLQGIYDFTADIRPDPSTDAFTAWKRVLEDQLRLEIESRKAPVPIVVVDQATEAPTAN